MVKKLHIKESRRLYTEVDKGYSRQVYQALDSDFQDDYNHKVDANYLSDQVELWLYNTQELYREIYNNRRKAYSVAYAAMLDLFQDVVNRYDVKVRVTSEMAKQWLKKNGLDYKEVLAPVTARIEEDRADKKNESFRRTTSHKRSFKESADDEIARKGFVSLIKDTFNGGYIVLNDGYFVCKISAMNDADAEKQFYDFLKTDWRGAWKDGTLPRYFGESVRRTTSCRRSF